VPPRVDYELTALGYSLLEPVNALATWARTNTAAMDKARAKFDEAETRTRAAASRPLAGPNAAVRTQR
jgi:hypothetical protein